MPRNVLSVALLLLPSTALAQEQYSITDLGCAGCGPNFEGGAIALNNNDEVVGMARHPDGQAYPFYWHDGVSHELPNAVGLMSQATSINDPGLVVGSVAVGLGFADQIPVVWDPPQPAESYTELPLPGVTNRGVAWKVNELGQAVGIAFILGQGGSTLCLWLPDGDGWAVTSLPYLTSFAHGNVSGISSSGAQIVGESRTVTNLERPVIWEQGSAAGAWQVTDLGTLGGSRGQATDVINEDEISGLSMTADGPWHATIWRRIEGIWTADEDLGVLPGDLTSASWNSNSLGQVVGFCIATPVAANPLDYVGPSTAFLWEAGVMHDLNDLVVDAEGWHLRQAWDISDTGRICGLGVAPNGELHSFLLEPVCAADVTGDGAVGVEDLVEVVLNWGPCDSCPADVDGSGVVDVADLVEVILTWGPCA